MSCRRLAPMTLENTGCFGCNPVSTSSVPLHLKDNAALCSMLWPSQDRALLERSPTQSETAADPAMVAAAIVAEAVTAGAVVVGSAEVRRSRRLLRLLPLKRIHRISRRKDMSRSTIPEQRMRRVLLRSHFR